MILEDRILKTEIEVSEKYPSIVETLAYKRTETMDLFYGGAVNRKDSGLRWVSPLILFSNDSTRDINAVYHLAYVNFDPTTPTDQEVSLVPFLGCETGIKCSGTSCNCNERFNELMRLYSDRPYIVMRRSFISNPAFPYITQLSSPSPEDEYRMFFETIRQLQRVGFTFSVNTEHMYTELPCIFGRLPTIYDDPSLTISGPRIIQNDIGTFYTYNVDFKIDIWENYEVISGRPLTIGSEDEVVVRFDSGCDSGQVYDDTACDCRDQLHSALHTIQTEGHGIVIHIPSHDGRGYGMAGKMETELYKLGRGGLINTPTSMLDTVKAAELLYGQNYDIRTYRGAAEILRALGIKSVRVLTDNADKFKAIKEMGIKVHRIKTGTNKVDCEVHIEAKHKTPPYNDEAWLEC